MEEERYYGQFKQDLYLDNYFNKKNNGVFVEAGAADGISLSNSYFFEKFRGWTGLCVEPIKSKYDLLCKNRKCYAENYALAIDDGDLDFIEMQKGLVMHSGLSCINRREKTDRWMRRKSRTYKVKSIPLKSLLDKYKLYEIDFFSLDVEDAEMLVLQGIDFEKVNIRLMLIENHEWGENRTLIPEYLKKFGYDLIDRLEIDDVYEKK